MSRRQLAFSVFGMLTVAALVPASAAQAGTEYFHASSCQELGNGESGAINRSFYRITNVGSTQKEVICPIPVDSSSTGEFLVVKVNVEDHHKSEFLVTEICHRDGWGNVDRDSEGYPICAASLTLGGTGRVTLEMELKWIPGGSYTFTVQLPPNSRTDNTDYFRFFSYSVARR
jgi:hypothetical protein